MKKVLITGGAGFIGFHLSKIFLADGYKVHLIDNFSRGVNDESINEISKNEKLKLINEDLSSEKIVKNIGDDYSHIFHFAAIIGVKYVLQSPYEVLSKNFSLLNNAIEIAKKQKKLDRFIFASTSEVYAGTLVNFGIEFPTPETTALCISDTNEPRTSYMLSKIYGEAMCLQSKLPTTIIRPHNFYGPRMGLAHVVPELMKKVFDAKENGEIQVFSINHRRTFCYIEDAVLMIKELSESSHSIDEIYNIGNPDMEVTIKDLAQLIINTIGKKITIQCLDDTPGSPSRRCPSMNKFNKIINYKNQTSLIDGLKKTYEWYEKNIFLGKSLTAI